MDAAIESPLKWSGTVKNGAIVLDDGMPLPEGARVEVQVREQAAGATDGVGTRLLKHAGTVHDLPADMADQHDHYIHGTPRR